jgi:hypothetical protein
VIFDRDPTLVRTDILPSQCMGKGIAAMSSIPVGARADNKNKRLTEKCCLWLAALVLTCSIGFSLLIIVIATKNSNHYHSPTNSVIGSASVASYISSISTKTSGSTDNNNGNNKNGNQGQLHPQLHLVFSTDCSLYQQWQSYVLYYSAVQVKQGGKITRIVSGCNEKQMNRMIEWHTKTVVPLLRSSPFEEENNISKQQENKFTIHFTPSYDHPIVETYKYVNKPFGLLHYFEHYQENEQGFSKQARHTQNRTFTLSTALSPDDIIAIIDPDMVFLRPLSHDFTPSISFQPIYAPGNDPATTSHHNHNVTTVQHGHPFAPLYGVGDHWRYMNLTYITRSRTSPALIVTQEEALSHYAVGSPYMGTMKDMYSLTPLWLDSVPTVREEYPEHISEMYSYIIGAADANLPHHIIKNLMISGDGGTSTEIHEGWTFLNHVPPDQICSFATEAYRLDVTTICSLNTTDINNDNWKCSALQLIPNFLHFCQVYHVGDWFWSKYHAPGEYLSCEYPLMATPPMNLGSNYTDCQQDLGNRENRKEINPFQKAQNAFMICAMSAVLQEAALYYKNRSCDAANANLNKTFNLYDLYTPPSSS